jgi:hypothetical protein
VADVNAWGIDCLSTRDVIRWGISRHSITPETVKLSLISVFCELASNREEEALTVA